MLHIIIYFIFDVLHLHTFKSLNMTKNTLKYFFKTAILLVLFLISIPKVNAQVVYAHNFNTYVQVPPYTEAPTTLDPNLSGSSWTNNPVVNWADLNGTSGTKSLALNNSSGTKTITLTFNVAAQKQLEVTSFNFWRVRSGSGAQNWAMTINTINVGSGIVPETGALLSTTAVNVANAVKGLTGKITVVLTLTGATGTGTFRLDDFTLNGAVTSTCTPATLTSISPASGPVGTVVTINGSGFTSAAATTAVKFNGVNASTYTVVSDNVIKATVAANTTSGAINITTNNCTGTSTATFSILDSNCNIATGEIYISELYDQKAGSGGMIELYNPSSSTLTFNGRYVLERYAETPNNDTSGNNYNLSYTLTLSGSIAPFSTYLVACSTPNPAICAAPTQNALLADANGQSGFNDLDKFQLLKDGAVIDLVKIPETIPGFTNIRKPDAIAPSATYNISDWINTVHPALGANTLCDNLGIHNGANNSATIPFTQPQSTTVCENGTATFTATISNPTGFTYQWKTLNASGVWVNVTNGNGFSGAQTVSLTINPATAALNDSQYYLEATSATCTIITNAVQLTVNPAPVAPTVTAEFTYCQGAIALPLTAIVTGTNIPVFYTQLTGGIALPLIIVPNTTVVGEVTYYVSQRTLAGCESARVAIKIIVKAPTSTVAEFTLPAKVCTGTTTVITPDTSAIGFTAGGVYSYTTTGTGTLTLNTSTGAINPATSTPGTYVVTYTVAGNTANCIAGNTYSQTIEIGPLSPAVVGFSYTNTTVCNNAVNEAAVTVAGFVTGGSFTYATTGTGTLSIDASTGEINVAASTPGTYVITYTVAVDNANCIGANTATATVTINPTITPVTGITYTTETYCTNAANATPVFSTGVVTGGTFTYIATTGGTLVINPATGQIDIATSTPGTYVVTYTVAADPANCQEQGSTDATVVITPLTIPVTNITYNATYCQGAANATPGKANDFTNGGTYIYTGTGTLVINPATGEIDFSASTAGTYTITYTVAADAANCQDTNSSVATIEILPSVTKVTDFEYETAYCYGTASATPTDFATGFTTGGTFTVSGGLTINPATGEIINLANATAGTYTVTYTVAGNGTICNADQSSAFTFTLGAESLFTITGECVGNAFTLTGTPTNSSFNPDAVSYAWTINNTSVGTDNRDFNFTDYIRNSNLTLPVTVTLTVTNGTCSTAKDFIVEDASCEIQRGISPGNGDDKNNFFDLALLGVKKLVIFNRYGKEVYSKNNYTIEWHGQTNNGDELPTGTYFYVIDRNAGAAKTGWIYINRQN